MTEDLVSPHLKEFTEKVSLEEIDSLTTSVFELEKRLTHSYNPLETSPYRKDLYRVRCILGDLREVFYKARSN